MDGAVTESRTYQDDVRTPDDKCVEVAHPRLALGSADGLRDDRCTREAGCYESDEDGKPIGKLGKGLEQAFRRHG